MHRKHPRALRFAACAVSVALVLPASLPAAAQTKSEKSFALAKEGAGHYKAKRYLEAARLFEEAYRVNPVDPRNLRYAGSAWNKVGHWERALNLLERYSQLATNAAHRQSIQPRIAELKKKTPRERADQLALATVKYPQGKLEIEAARALERLGKKNDLERALKLYETARLWATSPALSAQVNADIDRVKNKLIELEKKKNAPKDPKGPGKTGPPKQLPPKSDTLGTVLFVVGGVVAVAGAGLGAYGLIQGNKVQESYKKDQFLTLDQATYKNRQEYEDALSGASSLNSIGYVVAGVGGAVLAFAIVRAAMKPDPKAPAATTWWVAPQADGESRGMVVGLHF